MKIISLSDIHIENGDFETFDKLMKYLTERDDVKVLTVSGDLSGRVLEEEDERKTMAQAIGVFPGLISQIRQKLNKNLTFKQAAQMFTANDGLKVPDDLRKLATDYLVFEEKARQGMSKNYMGLKERFDALEKSGKRVFIIPGNWDGIIIDDFLSRYNLHQRYPEETDDIKFIGYGGAREQVPELPYDLTFGFSEDESHKYLTGGHFKDAEVVLTHTCPRGFENGKLNGEYALRSALFECAPSLYLVGHSHIPFVQRVEGPGTIIANPGNLGRYENEDFGTFLEFDINGEYFVTPLKAHKIVGDKIVSQDIPELAKSGATQ